VIRSHKFVGLIDCLRIFEKLDDSNNKHDSTNLSHIPFRQIC
jgi:hypothetical protein